MLVVIGSMPKSICNHFYEKLANSSIITTFTGYCFDALVCRFPFQCLLEFSAEATLKILANAVKLDFYISF